MDRFATETQTVAFLFDLNQRKRIKYEDNINREHWRKWGKNKRQSFINSLKKDYPIKPILCYTSMENDELTYHICDGCSRLLAIMKYLKKTMDEDIMNKSLVLEIVPSNIDESELNKIYNYLRG